MLSWINEIAGKRCAVGAFIVPALIYPNERIRNNDFYALSLQGFICLSVIMIRFIKFLSLRTSLRCLSKITLSLALLFSFA